MAQVSETKNGGPYTKQEQEDRREEVYRLHFEYGYTARKIAELMKINRNTINNDIRFWYSQMSTNSIHDSEFSISVCLGLLENQSARLREQLDKANTFSEKMSIERLLYDVNSKILHTNQRLAESAKHIHDMTTSYLNKWMKDHNRTERFMAFYDKISVSEKAYKKIEKIMEEDKKHNLHS